jgi:1-deoxy-D-xylulose-5-phosphate synthase
MRAFPNIAVLAPGDERDVEPMLSFALSHDGPVSIRYPKANAESVARPVTAVEAGKAEVYRWGTDGVFLAFGAMFPACVRAAEQLEAEGLDVGVINARFLRPLDTEILQKALEETGFVITVEESTLCGGFGSAVLEAANDAGLPTDRIRRIGLPDRFIEHGERNELLADLGLDDASLAEAARRMLVRPAPVTATPPITAASTPSV